KNGTLAIPSAVESTIGSLTSRLPRKRVNNISVVRKAGLLRRVAASCMLEATPPDTGREDPAVPARPERKGMTQSPLPEWDEVRPVASGAARKYRKGMRDLGQGLVALGILQGVLAILGLLSAFDPLLLGLLGGLGAIHLTLGILTLLRLAWAN